MTKLYTVNYYDESVFMCDKHLKDLLSLCKHMGWTITFEEVDDDFICSNCDNERKEKND